MALGRKKTESTSRPGLVEKATGVALLVAALACLVLLAARIFYAISFTTPWLLTTSGTEEMSLYAIWKVVHGQTVYTDPTVIPFTLTSYNWLFYFFYGEVAHAVLALFRLGDIWLPTVCRLTTLAFAFGCVAMVGVLLRQTGSFLEKRSLVVFGAVAVIASLHPLAGFWVITARPDVGALFFQLVGFWLVLSYLETGRLSRVVLAALALYLAWSFKQIAVEVTGGALLSFLFLQRWKAFAALSFTWAGLIVLTLVAGSPLYRTNLTFMQHCPFALSYGCISLTSALVKQPFFPAAVAGLFLVIGSTSRKDALSAPMKLTCLYVVASALGLELIASCKWGAADYYFLPSAAFSVIAFFFLSNQVPRFAFNLLILAASSILCLGVIAVLTGKHGMLDRRYDHASLTRLSQNLAAMPSPVFVVDSAANLPWIQPHPPYFVYDQGFGYEFTYKLVKEGYFKTLVVRPDVGFHPEQLAGYEIVRRDGPYIYYGLKP